MKFIFVSRPFSKESKREAIRELLDNTVPDRDFYILVLGAIILAACGILTDSIPVFIASMIVAPLAYPILGLGLGLLAWNIKMIGRAVSMLSISIVLTIIVAGFFSLFVKNYFDVADRVFISFFPNTFFDLLIAVISGAIASYGLVRSKVGGAMTGIGIAVSLMPPLVAAGIGLFDPVNDLALRAGTIFALNVVGILAGSMFTFGILSVHKEYQGIRKVI